MQKPSSPSTATRLLKRLNQPCVWMVATVVTIVGYGSWVIYYAAYQHRAIADERLYEHTAELLGVLEKQKLSPVLADGSLLGWARHGGVIPFHEDDVDIAVFGGHPNFKGRDYDIKNTSFGYQLKVPDSNFHIDVWVYAKLHDHDLYECAGHNGSCRSWRIRNVLHGRYFLIIPKHPNLLFLCQLSESPTSYD